jgi:hypothetical protein
MSRLVVVDPNAHLNLLPNGIGPDPSHFQFHFLAHGDSWFSIGSIVPLATTNILAEMDFPFTAYAVNCARPGDTLAHMVDWKRDPNFRMLLASVKASPWHAILMSAGGNDVIDAASVLPVMGGKETPRDRRLFLRPEEWAAEGGASRYISEEGWRLFKDHLSPQFDALVAARDGDGSLSKGMPVFFHLYDFITPRPSPSVAVLLSTGPWLAPALTAYGIPPEDWIETSGTLMNRLADIIISAATRLPNVHIVDTRSSLVPASIHDPGMTLHWANEIHPTKAGYGILAQKYAATVSGVVQQEAGRGSRADETTNSMGISGGPFPPLFIEPPETAVTSGKLATPTRPDTQLAP